MADVTRRIGLSLGADLCWPLCYEEIIKRLDLSIPLNGDTVRFDIERVQIEPFDLQRQGRYDVVMDRLTHWYTTSREWIKKAVLLDDTYVLNNPWSIQSMEKQTSYCAMMRLGLPVPHTMLVPPKEYEPSDDLDSTLERYAKLFDLGAVGDHIGYPMFMKPFDGGAWKGVSKLDAEEALREAYDKSGRLVMHVQKAVDPFDLFVRCVGVGPQLRCVSYDPAAALHDRYTMDTDFLDDDDRTLLEDMTLTINTFFGWDFNSCEALRQPTEAAEAERLAVAKQRGERPGAWAPTGDLPHLWRPIDYANGCPDSQVTSLHFHFPWLVLAKVRWSLFCAATQRKKPLNLNWQPFFDIVDENPDMPLRERLAAFGDIARERLAAEEFEAFCAEHLSHLDEVADEYFSGTHCKDAVHQKVSSLFPEHEIGTFTDLFWNRIQHWRENAADGSIAT